MVVEELIYTFKELSRVSEWEQLKQMPKKNKKIDH